MKNEPLSNKKFEDFLKEYNKTSKLNLVSSTLRTAYTREIAGEDNDKREEQLTDLNKNILLVKDAVESIGKNFTKSNEKVISKLGQIAQQQGKYNPVSDIKDEKPTTLKEQLKTGVAGVKSIASKIKSGLSGIGEKQRTPSNDIKSIGGLAEKFVKSIENNIEDIVSTPKEYTKEGGRFADILKKRTGADTTEGVKKFAELKSKEEEISKLQKDIDYEKSYGFTGESEKTKELSELKKQYAVLDPRNIPVSAKDTIQKTKPVSVNPNADNITTPQEEIADATKETSQTSKELLDITKESLIQLKIIKEAVTANPVDSTPKAQPTSTASAPQPQAPQSQGGGIGSMIGDAVGGAASAGVGGKILGGLGTAAKAIGGGLLTAGKVVGGALLSKPALIAGGVALAGYGAYKGYKALKGAFGGGDEKTAGGQKGGDEAKSTSVQFKESSNISLAKFAENDPQGFEEYQKYIQDEMEKGKDQIEKDFKSGKKKGAKEVFLDQLEKDVQERARAKFKDKMMAAGAMETKSSIKGDVKEKESTGSSYGDSVNKRTEELLAKAPANLKDDPGYQRRKRQQAELEVKAGKTLKGEKLSRDVTGMGDDSEYKRVDTGSLRQNVPGGIKAQHEQFVRDTKPGSGYKEEPVAPKKSIGQKIAGFFGFGGEESEGSKPQQESTGSSYGDAVNKRTEELLAKAPANLKDDIGYQRRKRQQAELEVKAGKTLKGEKLASVEEAPKEKTIGQKIAGFFGFGDKKEKADVADSAPGTYSESKTVEQLAMEEAKKYGRDKPNVEDTKAASMAFRKQALGGKSEGTLTGVSTIPKDKEARIQEKLNELPENMRDDPDVQQSIREEVDVKGAAPSSKIAPAKPIDKSKMHPMARRQLEALEAQNKMNQDAHLAELEAKKMTQSQVPATSTENAAMREELGADKSTRPVIVSTTNAVNNNTQSVAPIKTSPRHQNNAFERKQNMVTAF